MANSSFDGCGLHIDSDQSPKANSSVNFSGVTASSIAFKHLPGFVQRKSDARFDRRNSILFKKVKAQFFYNEMYAFEYREVWNRYFFKVVNFRILLKPGLSRFFNLKLFHLIPHRPFGNPQLPGGGRLVPAVISQSFEQHRFLIIGFLAAQVAGGGDRR